MKHFQVAELGKSFGGSTYHGTKVTRDFRYSKRTQPHRRVGIMRIEQGKVLDQPRRLGVGNSSTNFVPRPTSLCTLMRPP